MTSNDDALVEKMCVAVDPDLFGDSIPKWEPARQSLREDMRKAFAISRPIIEREALEKAAAIVERMAPELEEVSDAIRALIPRDEEEKP